MTPFNNNDFVSGAYGYILNRTSERYNYDHLSNCSLAGDGFSIAVKQFNCYQRFWQEDYNIYGLYGADNGGAGNRLANLRNQTEAILLNEDRYVWTNPKSESKQEYWAALDKFTECQNSREPNRERCLEARHNEDIDQLCTECKHDISCSYNSLVSRFEGLPNTYLKPVEDPGASQPGGGHHNVIAVPPAFSQINAPRDTTIANRNTHICVISKLLGNMDGLGEGAQVHTNNAAQWGFKLWTNKTDDDEKLKAAAVCVERANFQDTDQNNWLPDYYNQFNWTGVDLNIISLGDSPKKLYAVMGMQGKMKGGAEFVQISNE